MFRRPIRRAVRRMTTSATNQNEVFRANQFFMAGQYEQAASAFMQLAQLMERSGKPRQAANLHARAAIAWAKAGVEARATNQANLAFSQFTLLGMQQRISEFKTELDLALHPAAVAGQKTGSTKPLTAPPAHSAPVSAIPSVVTKRGKLPPTCGGCGAPVRPDQVEWIDDSSAECDFCGAILQAE